MAAELADFRAESKQLRNQELTMRRLEERARSLEAQLEAKVRRPRLCEPRSMLARTSSQGPRTCCLGLADAGQPAVLGASATHPLDSLQSVQEVEAEAARRTCRR